MLESPLSSEQISKLKGTGKRGMLTKGDVLLALGEIKNAYGSAETMTLDVMGPSGKRKSEVSLFDMLGGRRRLMGEGQRRQVNGRQDGRAGEAIVRPGAETPDRRWDEQGNQARRAGHPPW